MPASRAAVRSAWGQPQFNPASRFLDEIPDELLDWQRTESALMGRSSAPTVARLGGMRQARGPARPVPSLSAGDRVNHDKYGLGTVIASDGSGARATVTIDFGSSGKVRLMLIGGVPMEKL